jgi:class 3 adenylate cyclase
MKCPRCQQENPPQAKFCRDSARLVSPEAYTPKHLAERILNSKAALEGERKQVTVLFADLKGSVELLADRDPEEARKLLDPVLERMMEAVHRYEGTVNQVMGDGIMALFGAPGPEGRSCYLRSSVAAAGRNLRDEHAGEKCNCGQKQAADQLGMQHSMISRLLEMPRSSGGLVVSLRRV